MTKYAATALLLIALVLPVALFWLLRPHFHVIAAALAIAIGWALNVAWAYVAHGTLANDASQPEDNTRSIALRFGWICPTVLVLMTWLALRLAA